MRLQSSIRFAIARSGIPLRQLARRCGVRRQSISRFLAGGNLHLRNVEKVLAALDYRIRLAAGSARERAQAKTLLAERLTYNTRALERFCLSHGIRTLALYGSVLRKDFHAKSAIDAVADFTVPATYFDLVAMEEELRTLFATRHPVQLVTYGGVSPLIADEVVNTAEVLYANISG